METKKNKRIWLIVLVLLAAAIFSTAFYVSNIKKMAPAESEDVIELVPKAEAENETEADIEADAENDRETIEVEVPKSNLKNGAGSTGAGRTEKRQVGLMEAEMITEDEKQIWTTKTSVDIFEKYYYGTAPAGTEDEVTVENAQSVDRMNLIAPGTESSYEFWVKNTGQVGISYEISFEEHQYGGENIPLNIRLKCGNTYLLGDEDDWVSIHSLNGFTDEGRLHVKNYARYTLEWCWPFEEDDARDTNLGNLAMEENLIQEIIIYTYGEGYDRPIYETFSVMGVKTGDAANILLWLILVILAATAVYYIRKKRKRKEEEGE